jgi:hypothetical protein
MDGTRHIRFVWAIVVVAIFVTLGVMTFVTVRQVRINTGIIHADPLTPEAETYLGLHQAILEQEKRDPPGVLFLGDSITDFWRTVPWEWERFAKFHPCNAGIIFDQVQHALWRVQNGELAGIHPQIIVLEIGTNNLGIGHDDPKTTADGVRNLIGVIRAKQPDAKILLLGIFPRRDLLPPTMVYETNSHFAGLADGERVVFLDVGQECHQTIFRTAFIRTRTAIASGATRCCRR